MRKIIIMFLVVFVITNMTSCTKDFLNLEPKDQFSDNAVWNGEDAGLIEAFVNDIYKGLGHGYKGDTRSLSSYVDETMIVQNYSTSSVNQSLISPSSYQGFDSNQHSRSFVWEYNYSYIRACNLFFEKIEASTALTEDQKNRYKGEVYFLRAYLYNNLVAVYGGVPLITVAYKLGDEYKVARNTYEESINFIVSDLDKAAALIIPANKGRATKGAAMALKARVLLYAASDLYNSNASWAGGYEHKELVGYVGGNRAARWQAAKDAAKDVMDLGIYELYKKDPATGDDIAKNYGDIFLLKETSEDIFVKFYLTKMNENGMALWNGPNGFHTYGGNVPIAQLVDDYEMADGTKFSWSNPAQAANPYEGREPRFYASILYDGAYLRTRPTDLIDTDPLGRIQTGVFERWNSATNSIELIPGLDTRQSPIEDWNGTYTGYYLKKGMDPTVQGQFDRQDNPWRFMRYTEVLLNYAEASIELGLEDEAKIYINMIRKRAGLPDITETGTALVDRYRHERRIELALEAHRFFDVRRWMIAPVAYTNAMGINILHKLQPDHVTTVPIYTPTDPSYTGIQKREWNPRFYFLPIKNDEMNKNDLLFQNPLYN